MDINLINATPHAVNIYSVEDTEYNPQSRAYTRKEGSEPIRTIEASGILPRCSQSEVEMGSIDDIPLLTVAYGEVENLPEYQEGTYYIVSALAANAGRQQGRNDLLTVVRTVRDGDGRIVGCLALGAE